MAAVVPIVYRTTTGKFYQTPFVVSSGVTREYHSFLQEDMEERSERSNSTG